MSGARLWREIVRPDRGGDTLPDDTRPDGYCRTGLRKVIIQCLAMSRGLGVAALECL